MNKSANDEQTPLEPLSITETDIAAYVDGHLDGDDRVRIEGFLACNPDLAARVMQRLHLRRAAGSFRSKTPQSRAPRTSRIIAACLACGIAGWAVAEGLDDEGPFEDLSSTPEYVEDAVMALRVAHMRSAMHSQVETPKMDSDEIQRATHIRVPMLPDGWQILDTQIFPSEEGPSVSVLIETSPGSMVNLFAVRADTRVTDKPVITNEGGANAAYWEQDGAAYVLTANGPPGNLLAQAGELSRGSEHQ